MRVISVGFAQTFLDFMGLGPWKILRIGLLEIECESDFSRFCTDFSEFFGAWPQENFEN